MIIEVSSNNNTVVRERWQMTRDYLVGVDMHHFWQKLHFSSNHTSNKFPGTFVCLWICRQLAPLPLWLRLRHYRRFRARRPGGVRGDVRASEHHSLVTSDLRHPSWGWVTWVRPGSRHVASTSAWSSSPVWSSWRASPSSGSSTASSSVWWATLPSILSR